MAQTAHGGRLEREHVLNPVTALAFVSSAATDEQFLLAGEDTDLKVYKPGSSHICAQLRVFGAQSIHGIAVPPASSSQGQTPVIVWGAHNVVILPAPLVCHLLDQNAGDKKIAFDDLETRTVHVEAPDWILDAAISPGANERFALLTAHNEVIIGTVNSKTGHASLNSITSPSRPILYSGSLTWDSDNSILVAAGTVFGEIVVWKCQLPQKHVSQADQPHSEVSFVFSGHEGSIFGVHMSPEIRMPSGDRVRLLASCSDDRSIRIWDITEKEDGTSNDARHSGYETLTPDARETGFGDSAEAMAGNQSLSRCLATAMGHVSRIWHVEFPRANKDSLHAGIIPIYSFGEDATAQRWHLSLPASHLSADKQHQGRLTSNGPQLSHQSTFSIHSGKHIWSRAVTTDGHGQTLIATGGADGKIVLTYDKGENQGTQPNQLIALSLTDVAEASKRAHPDNISTEADTKTTDALAQTPKVKNSRESFQRYGFVTDSRLIVITNYGRVYIGDFGTTLQWNELVLPNEVAQALLNYSVLEVSQERQLALFGTSSGEIFYYRDSMDTSPRSLIKMHGKVADMFCLSRTSEGASGTEPQTETPTPEVLVTVLGSSQASLLQLDPSVSVSNNIEVSLEAGCVVTAAVFYGKYLIVGSRTGIMTVLAQSSDRGFVVVASVTVKLNDAVTCIRPIPNSPGHLLATCRDGKYRIYSLSESDEDVALGLLSEASPPFGPLIEGAWFVDSPNGAKDLLLCGFKSKHAVLWNETQRRELMTIECGGAHRSFAYTPVLGSPDGIRFVFSKASQMHIFSQMSSPIRTVKSGGHGREIRAVCTWGNLVATAAEDTQIRIWEHVRPTSNGGTWDEPFSCRAALDKHATGIQAMKWYENQYLFSSGGNEEFFVWKINRLNDINTTMSSSCCQLGVICEATFPDRSADGDLRIMNFDVKPINITPDANNETGPKTEIVFCITMALSNSTIQTYKYSRASGFVLLGRCSYTGACLTQLHHFSFGVPEPNKPIPTVDAALTAATDGHLAVFGNLAAAAHDDNDDGNGGRGMMTTTRLHQSSVKALDIRKIYETTENDESIAHYLIATGGDDNALGIALLVGSRRHGENATTTNTTYEFCGKWIVRSAHAAAVTGVRILGVQEDHRSNSDQGVPAAIVISISNDQRVRTWRVSGWGDWRKDKKLRIERVSDRYSSVADAGDLDVLADGKVLVGGVGMEVWGVEGL